MDPLEDDCCNATKTSSAGSHTERRWWRCSEGKIQKYSRKLRSCMHGWMDRLHCHSKFLIRRSSRDIDHFLLTSRIQLVMVKSANSLVQLPNFEKKPTNERTKERASRYKQSRTAAPLRRRKVPKTKQM